MSDYVAVEDQTYSELEKLLKEALPHVKVKRVKAAYEFARTAHEGQFRMSGTPYICHPLEVAKILAELQVDEETLIAALLHDVPEDTSFTVEDVEDKFGKKVAKIVDGLTKLSKVYYKHSMGERQIQSLRKMFLQTAKDPRVAIVKLADRLHNMSTLQYLRPDKQQRIARESLEIYAPLANLYGMYELRRKMEDFCFMYLQPEEYRRIKAYVQDAEKKREAYVTDMIKILGKKFKEADVEVQMDGRSKHFYSIYQKMLRERKKLSEIYDYFAIRVIMQSVPDCYRALGVVHDTFKPKPKRFKDYIAIPKSNGYRSLHSTVVGLKGQLVEIQIRTEEMHMDAEYGAAAHLSYKRSELGDLIQGIERLDEYRNPEEFIRGLQDDVLQDKIYVFSPDGEIVNLPAGATCLDYIFALDLPVNTTGFRALVNRRNYSLIGELQNGDHVEIVYGHRPQPGPERWWLEHVKTTKAREKIQEFFKSKSYSEKIHIGRQMLQHELDHENQSLIYELDPHLVARTLEHFELDSVDKLLASIGSGRFSAHEVYRIMFPDVLLGQTQILRQWWQRIFKPADEPFEKNYKVKIMIEAYDRVGLLADLIRPIYELNVPILGIIGKGYHFNRKCTVETKSGELMDIDPRFVGRDWIDVNVNSHAQLITLFDRLEQVPGVIRVQRVFRQHQIRFMIVGTLTGLWFLGHPFAVHYFLQSQAASHQILRDALLYIGFGGIFLSLILLRSMAKSTFPHFGETKYFWPLTFGLGALGLVIVYIEDQLFDLKLHAPILAALALSLIFYFFVSYQQAQKKRQRGLNHLGTHADGSRRGQK